MKGERTQSHNRGCSGDLEVINSHRIHIILSRLGKLWYSISICILCQKVSGFRKGDQDLGPRVSKLKRQPPDQMNWTKTPTCYHDTSKNQDKIRRFKKFAESRVKLSNAREY